MSNERILHDYEQRITELRAALRWVAEAVRSYGAAGPNAAPKGPEHMLLRIGQHAQAALLHDHTDHRKVEKEKRHG